MRQGSPDFLAKMKVFRLKSGIVLSDSAASVPVWMSSAVIDTGITVQDLMRMPVSFWLLDTHGATKAINPEGIDVCGFHSAKAAIGRSLLDVSKKESAIELIENCQKVIHSDKFMIFEECNFRKDGLQQQFLSVKLPWYDLDQTVVGVCGFSIVLGRHSLANNLSILARHGI